MELEPGNPEFVPVVDRRIRIEEPLPVKLVTVADATLPTPAGLERELDDFYVDLFGFVREADAPGIVYRAENFNLKFDVIEAAPERESMRPVGVEIESLGTIQRKLIDREIEYLPQKGTIPGSQSLLLTDPAGNWIEVSERREI